MPTAKWRAHMGQARVRYEIPSLCDAERALRALIATPLRQGPAERTGWPRTADRPLPESFTLVLEGRSELRCGATREVKAGDQRHSVRFDRDPGVDFRTGLAHTQTGAVASPVTHPRTCAGASRTALCAHAVLSPP
jgi:hypothetical protein